VQQATANLQAMTLPGPGGFAFAPEADFATLGELHQAARDRLDEGVWAFLDGGSGAEWTLRANRRAFDGWAFRPRMLQGSGPPNLDTTFLGLRLALPFLTAPFGADRLFHPDGQRAVVRAAEQAGAASIVPEAGSFGLEALAEQAPGAARVFQLHALGDPENFLRLAGRAAKAGYAALCVTVDCPTDGWRERIRALRFQLDHTAVSGNYPAQGGAEAHLFGPMMRNDTPTWTWEGLAKTAARADLPFIAKGILTAADALAALEAGASAIYVSNHGGRQLDGAPASLTQLPEVVGAVARRVPILFDSGVRRGTDVLKALALGADVVILGRVVAYGLAAGGADGVTATLELLRDEIRTSLTLLGRTTPAELTAADLQPAEAQFVEGAS
jgi:isopentenyl diphosphate isomerase/L-lactate dehydrogenase-like FMN-dependent dehydrogenase